MSLLCVWKVSGIFYLSSWNMGPTLYMLRVYLPQNILGIGKDADNEIDGIHNLSAILKRIYSLKNKLINNGNTAMLIWALLSENHISVGSSGCHSCTSPDFTPRLSSIWLLWPYHPNAPSPSLLCPHWAVGPALRPHWKTLGFTGWNGVNGMV